MIIESGIGAGRDVYRTPGQLENRSIEPKSSIREDEEGGKKAAPARARADGEDGKDEGGRTAATRPGSRVDIYA